LLLSQAMSLRKRKMLRSFTVLKTKGEVASSGLFSMSLPPWPARPVFRRVSRAEGPFQQTPSFRNDDGNSSLEAVKKFPKPFSPRLF
jgi:hypothetical protein